MLINVKKEENLKEGVTKIKNGKVVISRKEGGSGSGFDAISIKEIPLVNNKIEAQINHKSRVIVKVS